MKKCFTPCIYYHEIHDNNQKPSVKILCDIRENEDIKNISEDEINNCEYYKTYRDLNNKMV